MSNMFTLPTAAITRALQGDTRMLISCPECPDGTMTATVYCGLGRISVQFSDRTCECFLGQPDHLKLAASVLRQRATEMDRAVAVTEPAVAEI